MEIRGKVAIVTGASSGIGEATAKLFAGEGAFVVLAARSKDKLLKLNKNIDRSLAVPTDMTRVIDIKNLIQKTLQRFRRIDILVNNAGQGYDVPIEFIDMKTFEYIFKLDVVGPLRAMQMVIPHMRRQGGGAIVNISSGTALMHLPNMAGYSSLKRALSGISRTAAEELKEDHITVSVVYPYITDTDFEKNTIKGKGMKNVWNGDDGHDLPPADPPQHAAEKILEAVMTGKPEIFAHDWMGKPR